MIRSQSRERNIPPQSAAAAASLLDKTMTLPFDDETVPLHIANSGVAKHYRRVRCPSLPAKATSLSNHDHSDRREFFFAEGKWKEDSDTCKDGSSFPEEGRGENVKLTSGLSPTETCSVHSANSGHGGERSPSSPAKSATLMMSRFCEDSLEFSISESESDDNTMSNGTTFNEGRDRVIDFPPDVVSMKFCDIHPASSGPACSPQGIARIIHRLLRNRSWSDVIHLAKLHPDAVSVPVSFSFKGEKSMATALHVAASLVPPLDVVDALVTAHPESVHGADTATGRLPIHVAIAAGASSEVVRYLLQCHTECSIRTDRDGNGALHYAAMFGTDEVIKCIVEDFERGLGERGIEGDGGTAAVAAASVPNWRGQTALYLLCARRCNKGGYEEEAGRSVAEAEEGAEGSRLEAAQPLLRAFLSVSDIDIRGRSPLHAVCNSHNPMMWDDVKLLLDGPFGDVPIEGSKWPTTPGCVSRCQSQPHPEHENEGGNRRLQGEPSEAPRTCTGGSLFRKAAASIISTRVRRAATSAWHSRRPTEEKISLNNRGKSATYPRHASPITMKKRNYGLQF
uniref:Uncharacterized protein n=1 Tax=Pseudictyota dubia TaxID=2749911 RepID=A0A7R9W2T9_9STRA|mmetsp:Transcript_31097/g.57456  ORF Transcript_31097/g.57456 Transcript_31097/m.57456 type:complete len:567 (+) Transcript_31097:131-1831(+)|eukprot:CAMPEP_0197451364 /NCGR_PEP_ID=MMETSP1175-20131217/28575_1 /TAXON_ID=1003142 /ORGANISM="Triceratium dubium, Strain CCMP147" /LENGTH=566 /DNA_ID=CAMNT_0042984061 /DNA_START=130 /DNA_END=1830 /DNA_ORIENTATION=+